MDAPRPGRVAVVLKGYPRLSETFIAQEIRVRWLPVPAEPSAKEAVPGEIPVPDDAALRRIAGKGLPGVARNEGKRTASA